VDPGPVILPDQDWVRHLGHAELQTNDKDDKHYSLPENFNILSKILKIMPHLTTDEKDKTLSNGNPETKHIKKN
jgi:hypothetical protein